MDGTPFLLLGYFWPVFGWTPIGSQKGGRENMLVVPLPLLAVVIHLTLLVVVTLLTHVAVVKLLTSVSVVTLLILIAVVTLLTFSHLIVEPSGVVDFSSVDNSFPDYISKK